MAGCCDPCGYDEIFGGRFARRVARRYRRRGLDPAATRMVDFLAGDRLRGATVLEIGGGAGEIGVELLRRGAESVTVLELSSAYDDEARRLATEAGVQDRVHREVGDIATSGTHVEPADLVVLHRVVCCYPDHERLLGAAADHCRRRLAFSHPPRNLVTRALAATENFWHLLRGREFRVYAHPPRAMVDVVTGRGMRSVLAHSDRSWRVEGFAR